MIFTSTVCPSLEIGLRILGAWPDMPYTFVHRFICMSSLLIVHYFQYLYLFTQCNFGNLQDLVDPVAQIIYYTMAIIKLLLLWTNCRVLHELLVAMNIDWRECVNNNYHLEVMKTKASKSHFFTNILLTFNVFAGGVYFGSDNATAIIHFLKGDNDTSRPFPLKVLLPFQAQQSPLYELLVVVLLLQALSIVYMVAIMNSLLSTLVLHTSGQIDIVCQDFKATSLKLFYNRSIESKTGMLIEKHHKIIEFSENIDKFFSFVAFLQVFTNTAIMCYLALIGIISLRNENMSGVMKSVFAYPGITSEIFIFCLVGEHLSFKSKSLGDAGYESLWYNASPNHSKKILFIIMRSQKQLTITAGGIVNLSLETFASIMKASASYISILYAMY